jgi:hypothetical protein
MIYILIDGQFYRIFKESQKMDLLKCYSENRKAKIYTKKLLKK